MFLQTQGVTTGEELIYRIEQSPSPIDIAVIDENMAAAGGVLSGSQTCRVLKNRGFQGLVISMSGYEGLENGHEDTGFDIYWIKPLPKHDTLRTQLCIALAKNSDPIGGPVPVPGGGSGTSETTEPTTETDVTTTDVTTNATAMV